MDESLRLRLERLLDETLLVRAHAQWARQAICIRPPDWVRRVIVALDDVAERAKWLVKELHRHRPGYERIIPEGTEWPRGRRYNYSDMQWLFTHCGLLRGRLLEVHLEPPDLPPRDLARMVHYATMLDDAIVAFLGEEPRLAVERAENYWRRVEARRDARRDAKRDEGKW